MSQTTILWKAIVLSFIINYLMITVSHAATTAPDNIETSDWGTDDEEEFMPSFLHVKKLFNEGKPFFVEKDPVSGKLDFNHKKSAGVVENYKSPAEELIPLRTNEIAPNIHDFLHLPVKYSSSKSVYPLVSTSYASTKYQGSNKDLGSSNNHKEYSNNEIQKRPNFFTANAILPFEKTTIPAPLPTTRTTTTTTTTPAPPTPPRTVPTVTTFKPSFPRRPTRPVPTRFQETNSYWKRTEYPATTTTTTTSTTVKFTPTIPTTTTVKTTYSPTIPTTTARYESPAPTPSAEKVPSPSTVAATASPSAPSSPPPVISTTKRPPLVFPTESAVSLMEMLNNFADDTNPNVNTIQFNENAQPFQRPSGFRPAPPQQQQQQIKKDFSVATTTTTTTTTPRPTAHQSNSRVNFNDYVKYDIQAPNMVSFHSHEPVSSMNNIKISADQNVASFVLGSKQSFGGSENNNDVQLQIAPQPAKVIGQVFNEPISGGAVSIRFPSKEEETRFENVPVITGAHKTSIPNGHSAPFGFDPTKQRVSFPSRAGSIMASGQDSQMVGTKIVFESEDQVNGHGNAFPPTRETLPLQGNPNQRPITTGEDQGLTPPEPQRNRPPFPQKYGPQQGPKNPQQNRPGLYDPNLPNILPQFRPTPKTSHGQYPHQYKESGGYRQQYMSNPNRRVFPPHQGPGPIRRNYQSNQGPPPSPMGQNGPPMRQYTYQSNRFQSKMAPAPPPPPTKEQIEANRRMYKVPQTQPLYANPPRINPHLNIHPQPQASDRVYNVRPQHYQDPVGQPQLNMENSNRFGPMDPLTLKNNFIDEDSYKSPPQQEVMPSGDGKLEPVVTLQMIHTKKGGQGE